MRRPAISVVLPAFAEGSNLLANTLRSYSSQSAPHESFEVVVADDGGLTGAVRDLAHTDWGFAVRYVLSPRFRGHEVAHKNHARNAGWQAASAPLCFISDCDCLVPPRFVEQLLRAWDAATATGPACLYPMIACLGPGHMDWLSRERWPAAEEDFQTFLAAGKVSGHSFGGNYFPQRLQAGPVLMRLKQHPEGYQVLSRQLIADLGGFDEEFLGWGGNKQEFQDRVNETPSDLCCRPRNHHRRSVSAGRPSRPPSGSRCRTGTRRRQRQRLLTGSHLGWQANRPARTAKVAPSVFVTRDSHFQEGFIRASWQRDSVGNGPRQPSCRTTYRLARGEAPGWE